ncbi:MAG: S8 family serine peptidase, partial [Saprospiraceae bacterium]|nr:S8 family serine peptidase [Saprospiraceae bacterium]
MKQFVLSLSLLALFSMAFGQGKPDWLQKVDPYLLEKTASGQSAQFLILLAQQADLSAANDLRTKDEKAIFVYQTLRQTAATTQGSLQSLLAQNGATFESIFIVNAIKTSGNQALIAQIAQRPDVALLAGNPNIRMEGPMEKLAAPAASEKVLIEWGIDMINANDVWAMGYRGQGVVVGGQDTGYDWSHPALKNAYRGYDSVTDAADHDYNWHDAIHSISPLSGSPDNPCGLDLTVPCDDNSHGTHTMGTMIGLDGENEIGVAPEAQWCACRNMERGNGSP